MSTANNPTNAALATTLATPDTSQQLATHQNHDSNTLLQEGKSNAITVNTPFTIIPGLPALSKILEKVDRTTQQDLGFTFKANAVRMQNQQGEEDLQVNVDYIGFGLMSSKFNVQFSPVSTKVESGTSTTQAHWGCSASVLSSPIGFVHERAGVKGTFSDCNSTRTFSAATEFSYQKSNTFKPLSTATGGYFFGDSGTFRISAQYLPTLDRVKAASPNIEEWETIFKHIAPSIPAVPIGEGIDYIAQNTILPILALATKPTTHTSVETSTLAIPEQPETYTTNTNEDTSKTDSYEPSTGHVELPQRSKTDGVQATGARKKPAGINGIEASNEEKATYTVQKNDNLSLIAQKTGTAWPEIYALNKNSLKNNPHRIHPGQELLIPEHHQHAALINHPVVQAQILANLIKHQAKQEQVLYGVGITS